MVHEERICVVCNGPYKSRTKSPKLERYCGSRCRNKFFNDKTRNAKLAYSIGDRSRVCAYCGKPFEAARTRPHQKTCSKECSQADYYARRRALHQSYLAPISCAGCDKIFVPNKRTQRCCSRPCIELVTNREKRERYPKKRVRTFREIPISVRRFVLERDGQRCAECGKGGRILLHHIDASGETDCPNNDSGNLRTLCTACHKEIHAIHYRLIDGTLYVIGKIFDYFNVDTVKVLKGG